MHGPFFVDEFPLFIIISCDSPNTGFGSEVASGPYLILFRVSRAPNFACHLFFIRRIIYIVDRDTHTLGVRSISEATCFTLNCHSNWRSYSL